MGAPPPGYVPHDPASFARLVGPAGTFLDEVWTRRVHHHTGGDFTDLLSIHHVDEILSGTALRLPAFRLVRQGQTLDPAAYTRSARVGSKPIDDLVDVARVHDLFTEGATIVLQGLHRSWRPLNRFCRDLEAALSHPVQANAYLTPPVSSGLRIHADSHDVFALQTFGVKQWVTREPDLDLTLRPGDCLYVPRGTPHAARTVDQASLHVTIGVRATTWGDLVRNVLASLPEDSGLSEALPAGYADHPDGFAPVVAARLKEVAGLLASADADAAAEGAARRFWTTRTPDQAGQLHQLLALGRLHDTARVRRRPGTSCRVRVGDDRLVLHLADREVRLPAAAETAVRLLVDRPEARVGDLSAELDESSRLVLVRRLVREGLLEIVGE